MKAFKNEKMNEFIKEIKEFQFKRILRNTNNYN